MLYFFVGLTREGLFYKVSPPFLSSAGDGIRRHVCVGYDIEHGGSAIRGVSKTICPPFCFIVYGARCVSGSCLVCTVARIYLANTVEAPVST